MDSTQTSRSCPRVPTAGATPTPLPKLPRTRQPPARQGRAPGHRKILPLRDPRRLSGVDHSRDPRRHLRAGRARSKLTSFPRWGGRRPPLRAAHPPAARTRVATRGMPTSVRRTGAAMGPRMCGPPCPAPSTRADTPAATLGSGPRRRRRRRAPTAGGAPRIRGPSRGPSTTRCPRRGSAMTGMALDLSGTSIGRRSAAPRRRRRRALGRSLGTRGHRRHRRVTGASRHATSQTGARGRRQAAAGWWWAAGRRRMTATGPPGGNFRR